MSAKRDARAAERFFRKALKASHNQSPRVINVDKNAAYPKATDTLQADDTLPKTTQLRQNKYLKNTSLNKTIDLSNAWLIQGWEMSLLQHGAAKFKRIRDDEHDP